MQEPGDISQISRTNDGSDVNRYLKLGWRLLAVHQGGREDDSWTNYVLGWPRELGKCKSPDESHSYDPQQREDADWARNLSYRANHPVAEQRRALAQLGERLESLGEKFNAAVSERSLVQVTVRTEQQHCIVSANNRVLVFTHPDGVDGAFAVQELGSARKISGTDMAVKTARQFLEQLVADHTNTEG